MPGAMRPPRRLPSPILSVLPIVPALLVACARTSRPTPAAAPEAPCPVPRNRFLAVPDGALHVLVYGGAPDKEVAVFVHGWAHDASVWFPQIAALRERFAIVTYDLRGHGSSGDETHAGGDVARHAADLGRVLEQIGRPVHLVGHDLGAQIALRATLDAPARVKTLTLLSPALEMAPPVKEAYRDLAAEYLADPQSFRAWSGRLAVAWLLGPFIEAHPEMIAFFDAMMERHDHASVVGTLVASLETSFSDAELAAALTMPTLVIYGDLERWPGAEESERRLAALPTVTPVRVPRAAHEAYLEAPEAVNAALARHWRSR